MKLVPATAEEAVARDRLSYETWGAPLDREGWLERERRLRAHAWSRAALTSFLLREDDGTVLASCEAYRMQSWHDGAPGTSFGIASVYTEPRLRGQGHATKMMALLEAELVRREPGAHGVILFSDVGPELYRRVGYCPRPAVDLVFAPQPGDAAAPVDRLFQAAELPAEHARLAPPTGGFVVFPSATQCDWHLERERAYAELLGRPVLPAAGARAGDAMALWMASQRDGQLKLLLFSATRDEEARALVEAAQRMAHAAGLREVRLWDSPGLGGERALAGAVRVAREGSLPMLRPLAAGLDPERWVWIPRAIWV